MNRVCFGVIRLTVLALAIAVAGWALTAIAYGQIATGSISGVVIDQSEGAVPGADIRAINTENGQVFAAKSEATGLFKLAMLPSGTYRVEASRAGFKKFVANGVIVSASTDKGLGNIKLEVGDVTMTMEITAAPPLLQATQSQISSAIQSKDIEFFAGVGENQGLDRMVLMLPGVVNSRDNSFSNSNGADFAVNGIRGRNNDQQLDGQNNNDNSVGGPSVFIGNTEFVQEYQVVTNNFGPEYGRNAGSVVNIITKSGSNEWHGSVYATESNSALNTLNNIQKSFQDMDKLPRYNNIFHSYTLGGPLVKDKVFVFGGFDQDYLSQTEVYSTGSYTPTPAGLTQLGSCAWANAAAVNVLKKYGPFGITGGDPVISGTPEMVTLTNPLNSAQTCVVEMAGVKRTLSTGAKNYDGMFRIDFQTSKDRFYGRWYYQPNNYPNADSWARAAAGYPNSVPSLGQGYGFSWTRTLSSRMANELRINYGRISVEFGTNTIGNTVPSMMDIDNGLANINLPTGYADFGPGNSAPQGRVVNTYQVQDNWSYIVGNHQFKAGVNWTQQRSGNRFLPNFNGTYNYGSISDYIANRPSTIQVTAGNPVAGFRENTFFAYFGDDYKVTRELTLNLGLTWSFFTQPSNYFNDQTVARESNAATSYWDPTLALSLRTVPRLDNIKTDFGPSIGFAYAPGSGKTVFRGGYRLAYDPPFYNIYLNMMSSAPIVIAQTLSGNDALAAPLPADPFGPAVRSQLSPYLTFGVSDPRKSNQTRVDSDFGTDRVQSWSFGIQREIVPKAVVEARYVGNHGGRLFQTINQNPRVSNLIADFPDSIPSNIKACTDSTKPGYRRADCELGLVRLRTNTGYSDHHGLQLEFRGTNLANQLSLRTAFTWSKTTDNVSEIFGTLGGGTTIALSQNPFDYTTGEHGLSALDRPKTWTLSFNEEIPAFREQHGLLGKILGGWSVSGTYLIASGEPYTPVQYGLNYFSGGIQYYDVSFNNAFVGTYETARPYISNMAMPVGLVGMYAGDACGYFGGDAECGMAPETLLSLNLLNKEGAATKVDGGSVRYIVNAPTANAKFGTPWGTAARNSLRTYHSNTANLGVYKRTKVTERVSLQFHASLVNVFNHPNFVSIDPFIDDAGYAGEWTGFADPTLTEGTTSSLGQRQIRFGLKLAF